MLERTARILVPMIFGMLAIVPLHVLLWQKYYSQDLEYEFYPVHLWFLGNIFAYVLILSPLFFWLKKLDGKLKTLISRLFASPLGFLLIIACFILEAVVAKPETYATFAMNWHGFFVGLLAFLFGFLLIWSGETAKLSIIKWKWLTLALASGLFAVRYVAYELAAPSYLIATESVLWIITVFGFAFRYLNRPGKVVIYLSQAAYPVYILHMLFLYLASAWVMPMELHALLKFLLITVITFSACMLSYEFLIRRVNFIRPLFGLKLRKRQE